MLLDSAPPSPARAGTASVWLSEVRITRFALTTKNGLAGVADADNAVRLFTAPAHGARALRLAAGEHHRLAWGLGPMLLVADNDGELAARAVP